MSKENNKNNNKNSKTNAAKPKSRKKLYGIIGAAAAVLLAAVLVVTVFCGNKEDDPVRVKVEMENGGEFTLELRNRDFMTA